MAVIDVRGDIIPNDTKWIYDWLEWDSTCPNDIRNALAEKEEGEVQATYYHSEVVPAMEALRVPVDKLEMIVDKEAWPMPSYGDLIFEV